MSFFLRSASALCHVVGYAALAICHRHEPTCLAYGLSLLAAALHTLRLTRRRK